MNLHQTIAVPPPSARADLTMKDGAVIRLRRYGKAGSTRLVLGHGNGLAINAYAPFWLPLADRYDLVVFDMRNHGENPLHTREGHVWENFFSDIEEVFQGIREHFGPARTVAVMHSLSSMATLEHAWRNRGRWDAICVFDPPMAPPADHPLQVQHGPDSQKLSARAARRQAVFDTPDDLAAQYRRPAFGHWRPEQADLLARATVRRIPDGRWELSCPPAFEAFVFGSTKDPTLFHRMTEIGVPLRIIAGDPASPYASPAASVAQAARQMLGVDVVMVPGTTHFLQFEEPQACRDLLIDFLRQHGLD
ncbi:MAG: alpha/beta fold hydrolase [Pseudorhodoplanes sp.]|uniref:alpha/beta fold hydrolase n=1 Tax=Pseudorhodoplanes sp. TaxID=1934341 RepID=UPI003D0F3CFE